jgi:apolipoprotein N-acyltransferase
MRDHAHFLVAAVGAVFAVVAGFAHGWLTVAAAVAAGLVLVAAFLMYGLGRRQTEPAASSEPSGQSPGRNKVEVFHLEDQAQVFDNEIDVQIFMGDND